MAEPAPVLAPPRRTEIASQQPAPPPAAVPRPVANLIRSPGAGQPLPTQVAAPIARTLSVDVERVRVHSDDRSAAAVALMGARAFAWGTHVFLGPGERPIDLPLLAHEVAHVVQQQGKGGPAVRLFTSHSPEPYEREAHAVSAAVVAGRPTAVAGRTGGPRVQGLFDWAKKGIAAVGKGISAVASAVAEIGSAAIDAALAFVKDKARLVPGYDALAFVIGRDPVTQQPVERSPVNLIKAIAGLVPGGAVLFDNIEKAGVIQRAFAWLGGELGKLGLTWDSIRALFKQAWDALSVSDLLSPSTAWEKLKRVFGPPIAKIADFALAAGKKLLELIFEGALALGGGAAQQVLGIFRRVLSVFQLIVADPVKFLANLAAAAAGGFKNFAGNILTHLKTAIFEWLLGALGGAVRLPAKLDLRGIIDVVLQVLGLTYDRFRERLVKLLGEPAVKFIEGAFDFLKTLVTEGIAAAWQKVLEFATGLVDTVIGAIRDWVSKSIVTAAVMKLVTLFNPLGALIQAIIGIYNTVMFFIERAKQVAALLTAIVDSIENIAQGRLGAAIDYVEKTLVKALVVIIGFLARFVGLGKVADAVKDIIKKIQDAVWKAIDKVIAWVQNAVKGLLGRQGDKPAAKADAAAVPEKAFEGGGATHRLWFKQQGAGEVPMVSSETVTLSDLLDTMAKRNLSKAKRDALAEARKKLPAVEAAAGRVAAKEKPDQQAAEAERQGLLGLETELAKLLKTLLDGTDASKLKEFYALEGLTGTYAALPKPKGDLLTGDHQPQHALLKYVYESSFAAKTGPGSKTSLFKNLGLEKAIASRSAGAWAVNLHDRRHKLGRTHPKSPESAGKLAAAQGRVDGINTGPGDPDQRRTLLVTLMRDEMKADVSKILGVVAADEGDKAVWGDIYDFEPKIDDPKPFIKQVREQVKKGEAAVSTQDMGAYAL